MTLCNIHLDIQAPGPCCFMLKGMVEYYHYGCGDLDDRGWGCGYRTIQTISSWIINQTNMTQDVPTLHVIQNRLVEICDKPHTFVNSRQWIGSFEACLFIESFFNIACKMLHIPQGRQLLQYMDEIVEHFKEYASPVMMGGDLDASSKCILGVCVDPASLLIMDPHYYPTREDHHVCQADMKALLQSEGWVQWRHIDSFDKQSFYNLCMPHLVASQKHK